METILESVNIVILASNYNPSIISKDWLRDKGIINEEPLNFAHTPVFSMLQSDNFLLTVDDSRLTLSLKNINESNINKLSGIASLFVECLRETPYKALGLNFKWIIHENMNKSLIKELKEDYISLPKRELLEKLFDDFSLGSILYTEYKGFLLKIIIEPNLRKKNDLVLSFNYHLDLADVNVMIEKIEKFHECFNHSKKISNDLFNRSNR